MSAEGRLVEKSWDKVVPIRFVNFFSSQSFLKLGNRVGIRVTLSKYYGKLIQVLNWKVKVYRLFFSRFRKLQHREKRIDYVFSRIKTFDSFTLFIISTLPLVFRTVLRMTDSSLASTRRSAVLWSEFMDSVAFLTTEKAFSRRSRLLISNFLASWTIWLFGSKLKKKTVYPKVHSA